MIEYRFETIETPVTPRLWTLQEVASYLSVHVNTVRRLVNAGELKAYRISVRGDCRFKEEDVQAFLAGRRTG